MIGASCHCGAVRLRIEEAPMSVTDCNCSICRRLGVLWAYYRPDQVEIVASGGATTAYVWGDRMLAFHHCKVCGCATHWKSLDETTDRMGINARLFDPAVLEGVRVRRLDGADTWTYLDESSNL
jgi:hypothetical protein